MSRATLRKEGRVSFGFHFQKVNSTMAEYLGMAAGSQSRKLRDHIFNCKCDTEKVHRKLVKAAESQSHNGMLPLVRLSLPKVPQPPQRVLANLEQIFKYL